MNFCISTGPTYMTQTRTIARKAVNATSFQKHLRRVVLTGFLHFSCGLGHLDSKSSDIRSALCSGERVGTSLIVRGALYPLLSKGFIHSQKALDVKEAVANPLTFDFSRSGSANKFSSSSPKASCLTTIIPVDPLMPTMRRTLESTNEIKEIASSNLKAAPPGSPIDIQRIKAEATNKA
uniref:Uncharacterized protein n=1 Tax=Opuntia streptacantha TaxID=393608 RepID=A0A7C8YN35_OPUST